MSNVLPAILLSTIGLTACSQNGTRITGNNSNDTTFGEPKSQAESAITVSRAFLFRVVTVFYNNETESIDNGTIRTSSSGRIVYRGASEAGFSYSTDDGVTWTYGGTIAQPNGWAVLWSDPAATSSPVDGRYAFGSYLAIPDSKFPTSGEILGPVNNFLGGACILRSNDFGQHFSASADDCVRATDVIPEGDFYDGGSMAAAPDGSIYAAFEDVSSQAIHVWRASTPVAHFVRMPDPFPTTRVVLGHPRIRVDPATSNLYVLAPGAVRGGGDVSLMLTRWDGSSWSFPVDASTAPPAVLAALTLSNGGARRSPEYSFDVGEVSGFLGETDAIRVLYTTLDSETHTFHLQSMRCKKDASVCFPAGWSTTVVPGDQFSPLVRFFPLSPSGPLWKASWMSRENDPNGVTFRVLQGNLIVLPNTTQILIGFFATGSYPVCQSTTTQYFGDYDDMQEVGTIPNTTIPLFLRTFSDSSFGCVDQWPFSSWHLHVSAVRFQ